MIATVNTYAAAITSGQIGEIGATLAPSVKVMPPGANPPNEGIQKASMLLSAVAAVVGSYRFVRIFEAGSGWFAVALEGVIDGNVVQFIDQLHVGDDGLIDHIDIFLRPATVAPALLSKVTAEIQTRMAGHT